MYRFYREFGDIEYDIKSSFFPGNNTNYKYNIVFTDECENAHSENWFPFWHLQMPWFLNKNNIKLIKFPRTFRYVLNWNNLRIDIDRNSIKILQNSLSIKIIWYRHNYSTYGIKFLCNIITPIKAAIQDVNPMFAFNEIIDEIK